jgi:hypothetical protein
MGQRLELHAILKGIPEVEDAYFQPKQNTQLTYPCITYQLSDHYVEHANNANYWRKNRYSVTVIDRNPDSSIVEAVADLPYTEFDRFFVTEGLNHTVFQTFF